MRTGDASSSLAASLRLDADEVAGFAGVLVHLAPRVVCMVVVAAYFVCLWNPSITSYWNISSSKNYYSPVAAASADTCSDRTRTAAGASADPPGSYPSGHT